MKQTEIVGKTYKERVEFQLNEWVLENSIHNNIDDECCPDFSCCVPELLAKKEMRETFKALKIKSKSENESNHPCDDAMTGMLMGFLGEMITKELPDKNVHITDGNMSIKKNLN